VNERTNERTKAGGEEDGLPPRLLSALKDAESVFVGNPWLSSYTLPKDAIVQMAVERGFEAAMACFQATKQFGEMDAYLTDPVEGSDEMISLHVVRPELRNAWRESFIFKAIVEVATTSDMLSAFLQTVKPTDALKSVVESLSIVSDPSDRSLNDLQVAIRVVEKKEHALLKALHKADALLTVLETATLKSARLLSIQSTAETLVQHKMPDPLLTSALPDDLWKLGKSALPNIGKSITYTKQLAKALVGIDAADTSEIGEAFVDAETFLYGACMAITDNLKANISSQVNGLYETALLGLVEGESITPVAVRARQILKDMVPSVEGIGLTVFVSEKVPTTIHQQQVCSEMMEAAKELVRLIASAVEWTDQAGLGGSVFGPSESSQSPTTTAAALADGASLLEFASGRGIGKCICLTIV